MASAIPGGAPGYDYDKEFGNNIAHFTAQTSQRLRALYRPNPGSQGEDAKSAIWSSVTGFRPFGEHEFAVPCHAGSWPSFRGAKRTRNLEIPGSLVSRAPRNDSLNPLSRRLRRDPLEFR